MRNKDVGRPPMLIIGASHVTHLESYINNSNTPLKYRDPFKNTFFLGVGGTKWETCLRHFQGLDLTTNNKHLGNQWRKYYQSPIKPIYTLILLGSNSIDEFDRNIRRLKKKSKKADVDFWKDA